MDKNSRIYVAGHTGLVGSAIVRELERKGYKNIFKRSHEELDLRFEFPSYPHHNIEYFFNCAAHAGGIKEAIDHPVEMLLDNLRIQDNIIEMCHDYEVKKLLNIGSSCIYPVDGPQPYKEEQIGTGKTDENWSYAIAKLAGIELCRAYHYQYGCNFISAIPCNMYGINDNFDLEKAHVIPALIRKCIEGGFIEVWGDGTPKREFLYVDDFAKAAVWLMEKCNYDDLYNGVINIGPGKDITINELQNKISNIVAPGRHFTITQKPDTPNGVSSKLLDVSRINALGWKAETSLEDGIRRVYEWYKEKYSVYN